MDEAGFENGPVGTVGAELHAAREEKGLALREIADRTRIPLRHLGAIEASDYASLPAATYSAGFVRTYARLLGLDAQAMSQRFRTELGEAAPGDLRRQESYAPADPARVPSRGLVWVTLLLAALIGVGYLYWRGTQLENPAAIATAPQPGAPVAGPPQRAAPPEQTAPVATVAQPAAAAADGALLTAVAPVWLRVSDTDGTKLFQGVLQAGDHFQVPPSATDPRLRTSRATVLKVTVGSVIIPPLGLPETLIKDVSLKPAALLARVTPPAPGPVAPLTPVAAPAQ